VLPLNGEEGEDAPGESLRRLLLPCAVLPVRDLRKPCAEEGRAGEDVPLLGEVNPAGGAEGDQGLPATSASS
jgi:hypothetical protein